MVKIIAEDGKFRAEGSFDFGYAGVFRDGQIQLRADSSEVRNWECLRFFPDTDSCSEERLAEYLTGYVNGLEKSVQRDIVSFNTQLLHNMYFDMEYGGIEFWECKELTVPGLMPPEPDYDKIYGPASDGMQEYLKTGETAGPGEEAVLREILPMFNWDALIKSIIPERLSIKDTYYSFQCSDGFGGIVLCGAYCEFESGSDYTDWHNF